MNKNVIQIDAQKLQRIVRESAARFLQEAAKAGAITPNFIVKTADGREIPCHNLETAKVYRDNNPGSKILRGNEYDYSKLFLSS